MTQQMATIPMTNQKIKQIKDFLHKELKPNRFEHVLSVRETAINFAMKYKADLQKVELAALLHDCAKWMSNNILIELSKKYKIKLDQIERENPALLHAKVGAEYAKDHFGITDSDVLNAIRNHTTGTRKMSLVDKILYVADFCEPKRNYQVANDVYKTAEIDLDSAMLEVAQHKIIRQIKENLLIHPNTIDVYNTGLRLSHKKKKEIEIGK